jgi:hypothetical protein
MRNPGGGVDAERRRALCSFYREEFLRHLQHIESSGLTDPTCREAIDRAYRTFMADLEGVCWRSDFPAVAESLLQSFETLTRLSELDPRQGH